MCTITHAKNARELDTVWLQSTIKIDYEWSLHILSTSKYSHISEEPTYIEPTVKGIDDDGTYYLHSIEDP